MLKFVVPLAKGVQAFGMMVVAVGTFYTVNAEMKACSVLMERVDLRVMEILPPMELKERLLSSFFHKDYFSEAAPRRKHEKDHELRSRSKEI